MNGSALASWLDYFQLKILIYLFLYYGSNAYVLIRLDFCWNLDPMLILWVKYYCQRSSQIHRCIIVRHNGQHVICTNFPFLNSSNLPQPTKNITPYHHPLYQAVHVGVLTSLINIIDLVHLCNLHLKIKSYNKLVEDVKYVWF